jgi:hypothetical protein
MTGFLWVTVFLLLVPTAVVCGQPVEADEAAAVIQAAREGDARSRGILSGVYRRGEWGSIDYGRAFQLAQQAAGQDDPFGLYNLAVMCETGIVVERDSERAADLYHRASAPLRELATEGDCRAQVNLGYLLEDSEDPDGLQKAIQWYRQAATAGDARAQFVLGYKYYHGWGVELDYREAAGWFNRSAEQGYPAAQHFLGNMYLAGRGVPQNAVEATGWFRSAETLQYNTENISPDSGHYTFNGVEYPGDVVIPNLLPPVFRLEIPGGSCGESCLWSLINSGKFIVSQLELNGLGGNPGRGLYTNEMHLPLDSNGLSYTDSMDKSYFKYTLAYLNPLRHFVSHSDKYRDFLYDVVIENLKRGNPVILGVKIYPDKHYLWDCDHFILLVGYNQETDELVYNNFNRRERISAEKLLTDAEGYSLLNRYHFTNCIIIEDFGK